MGKKKDTSHKQARKERAQAAREARRAAQEAHERAMTRRRIVTAAIAVLTAVAAAVFYWGFEDRKLTGVSMLTGGLIFLMYSLGTLGAGVKARDRHRAGSIDFGTRK